MHLDTLSFPIFEGILFLTAILAGVVGSVLGLGGGLVVIPVLTLIFHVPIHYVVGASIVAVIATSSGSAAVYVRDRITNVRLAIFLEIGTTIGALVGATLAAFISARWLYLLFAAVLLQSAVMMVKAKHESEKVEPHPWANKLKLNSSYPDRNLGREVYYHVAAVPLGLVFMFGAGVLSALLGIGSGILKVLAMDSAMKLPIKVSSATSNFMIGVTAAASAGAYLFRGWIIPQLAVPIAIGVLGGAMIGTRLMTVLSAALIRKFFVVVLLIAAVQMALRGFQAGGVS
jgi:uncharacterized membrane protein YfcA